MHFTPHILRKATINQKCFVAKVLIKFRRARHSHLPPPPIFVYKVFHAAAATTTMQTLCKTMCAYHPQGINAAHTKKNRESISIPQLISLFLAAEKRSLNITTKMRKHFFLLLLCSFNENSSMQSRWGFLVLCITNLNIKM